MRAQFSQPYRMVGTTQTSYISLDAMGFRFPWKAPFEPNAKKALLAFLIPSSIALEAEVPCPPISKALCTFYWN